MKKIIIALDGPAGSGKTTTAREVAKKLNYIYIDTGAMYRATTLAFIRSGKELEGFDFDSLMDNIKIELEPSESGQRTLLNGEDVSKEIRTAEVTKLASPVAAIGIVREKLVDQQRELGKQGGVVMDGRDIGTVVFPNADLKLYMHASIEARAERRTKELIAAGSQVTVEEIAKLISDRDDFDSNREISPLRKADDAKVIDTSNITIEDQTNIVIDLANKIINS
ncbi:MAG: (d)CMP kinase [Candidatus Kapaibacterium sp.]